MKYLLLTVLFHFALITSAQVSFNIDSVSIWRDANLEMDGRNRTYNEIWGFVRGDREYGVIGSRGGTYIVDITNVKNPELVKFVPGAYGDATNRDYKDFNGYLYMVCDQGPSTLQIADLHYLPDSIPLVYDSDALFTRCHNLFIDSLTAHLYACIVTVEDSGSKRLDLQIYDLSNSYIPELLLTYDDTTRDGFHDIYVRNDTAIGNNMHDGLFFYDFSDLSSPEVLKSIIDYPDKGLNHAGYASVDGKFYYFSDETKGTDLKVVDVDEYFYPEVVGVFNAGVDNSEIVAHNVLVRDSFLFVSYYHEGLQVYDISIPSEPKKIGHYQTYTNTVILNPDDPPVKDYGGFSGAWGVYPFLPSGYILVSDREKGMFILDVSKLDGIRHFELLPTGTVFPNPFLDYVDIVYPPDQIIKIEVFDVNGKIVESSTSFEEVSSITRLRFRQPLNAGMYILKVETQSGSITNKIVKE